MLPINNTPAPAAVERGPVKLSKIGAVSGQRIALHGGPGIGKTSLALTAPGPTAFIDLEKRLPLLKRAGAAGADDVLTVDGITTYNELREALNASGWDKVRTIVIDSATLAEDMTVKHVLKNVRHEKGQKVDRLEDYGWGKGYRHLFDAWLLLISDFDRHADAGRNVIVICHSALGKRPNPMGDDFMCYQLALQHSDKVSLREKFTAWCDHLFYIGYDVSVNDGKATCGARTIYTAKQPTFDAKSTLPPKTIGYDKGSNTLWERMGIK